MNGCTHLKKLTLIALACFGFVSATYAATDTGTDTTAPSKHATKHKKHARKKHANAYKPVAGTRVDYKTGRIDYKATAYKPVTASVISAPAESDRSRFYVTLGAEYYSINLPTYRLPITFGKWVASNPPTLPPTGIDKGFNVADTTAGNLITMPSIDIGYNLKDGSAILPHYLENEAFEVDYSQFNRATKDLTNYTGADGVDAGAAYGVIWKINSTDMPIYLGGAVRIVNSFIHSSVNYHDGQLLFKGDLRNLPQAWHSTVRVGLEATSLDQFYSYSIGATTQGTTHIPIQASGDDSITSHYYGVTLGDQLEYKVTPIIGLYVDAAIQGLYQTSSLTANEIPDGLSNPAGYYSFYHNNVRVTASNIDVTYRAQASLGANIYPKFKEVKNVKVSIFGGLDAWGNVPGETTITAFGATAPHISNHTMRNYFAGLGVTLPID